MILDLYVVEWSPSQRCFHLQTVIEMVRDNLNVLMGKSITDYLCVGVFESYDQASDFIARLQKKLDDT